MGILRRFFANSILKNVDMLKMPVNLSIEGQPDYRTSCGGCLSIVGFVALLLFSISQLMKYFNQELTLVTSNVSNGAGQQPLDVFIYDFLIMPQIKVLNIDLDKYLSSEDIYKVVTPVLEVQTMKKQLDGTV